MPKFQVVIQEMSKFASPEEEWVAAEFESEETATEFARRWTRASVEELRRPNQAAHTLKEQWNLFGDNAYVRDGEYAGIQEVDEFIQRPATPEEIDWKSIKH